MTPDAPARIADLQAALLDALRREETIPCADDPEPWFADPPADRRAAVRACMSCPVRVECHDAAVAEEERFAVRGGIDFAELHRRGTNQHRAATRPSRAGAA